MDNLIKLSSLTSALRAKDILKQNGIYSKVARIPSSNGKGNCSYGLKINNRLQEAVNILREKGIKVSGRALEDVL